MVEIQLNKVASKAEVTMALPTAWVMWVLLQWSTIMASFR
jgi:hypothetical protein